MSIKIKFIYIVCLSFLLAGSYSSVIAADNSEEKKIDIEERVHYLATQCTVLFKKANWDSSIVNGQVKAYRFRKRYDEITVDIKAGKSDSFYYFTLTINENGKQSAKTFRLTEDVAKNDNALKETVLSSVLPYALTNDNNGEFRKAYSSVFSFGYSRTSDNNQFYPENTKGNLNLSWQLLLDPSARITLPETTLRFGDYLSFLAYVDFNGRIRANFFNIDLLLYGKSKYRVRENGSSRLLFGFFNGLEYFRPGFSDKTMRWDHQIYKDRQFIQYGVWRALQGNFLLSRTIGTTVYSAEFMAGAGMGVGPSSLFLSGITEEEEPFISKSFRSIKYRKQNYYFSYAFPFRLMLSADRFFGFRFEFGYNYYFFTPVIRDNLHDMLHILKCSAGYYLSDSVALDVQYERWIVNSMYHDKKKSHFWNRLIIGFRNNF